MTEQFLGIQSLWQTASLELVDVQPLWGGRRLVVNGNGTAVLTTITRGGSQTTRYFSLAEPETERLFQLCVAVDFVTIVCADRMGVPDEARPVLTLVNGNGRGHTIAKWANDKNERFDAVYETLLKVGQEH